MSEHEIELRRAALSAAQRKLLEQRLHSDATAIIPKREERGSAPLSFAQQRLWFLDQLMPGTTLYNEQMVLPVPFSVDTAVLERCLNEIVQRHEILRTRFLQQETAPIQVIDPVSRLSLSLQDLRGIPAAKQKDKAQRLATEQARQPFDLSSGPLLRATLLKLADHDALLVVTMHHIVTDGWSVNVFVRELNTLYETFASGKHSPLAPLRVQYADYAVWEREHLQGAALDKLLAYWTEQLKGLSVLQLPTDHPRPRVPSFHGAQYTFTIPQEMLSRFRAISQQQQCTLYVSLLAIFSVLLHRYSQQDEVVVGMPVANRGAAPELEILIGFFVNTLVLRIDLAGDPCLLELLHRVQMVTIGAQEHQMLPFEMLVERLQPKRDLSANPLCQVAFQLLKLPDSTQPVDKQDSPPINVSSGNSKFDLRMDIYEGQNTLTARIEYSTDLFMAETIARLAGHFQTLLLSAAVSPELPVSRLALLTEEERKQILGWKSSAPLPAQFSGLHQWVERHAAERPDAPAVVFGETTVTYSVLNRRANQVAHFLKRNGVGSDTLVGLCVRRSPEMIIGLVGILKAGSAFVPLDPTYPSERLRFMIDDSRMQVLVTETGLSGDLGESYRPVLMLDALVEAGAYDSDLGLALSPDQLAYVIYTSGSTGTPKGTQIEHRGLLNMAHAQVDIFGVNENSRVLQFSSLSFDASVFEIVMAFFSGGALYLGTSESLLPGAPLAQFLRENEISIVTLPPSALAVLPVQPFPALRTITVAGEACPAALVDTWAPGRSFFNLYGPTEATIWTTYAMCLPNNGKPMIGHSIPNTQVYILDDNLDLVPIGVPGELAIGGIGVARGYLNREPLTSQKFIASPFDLSPAARLYRTGDRVRALADGTLEYLGRLDQQIKLRGYRIEIGEIERVLAQHPNVRDAVVTGQATSSSEPYLTAYVVAKRVADLSSEVLKAHLRHYLPEYMVPSHYAFLDVLPLTPNGKIDRKSLPALQGVGCTSAYTTPQTEMEKQVAEIWQACLNIDRVGIYDNFFDLGGHSLALARVHTRLKETLHTDVSLLELFQYPTVKLLAERLGYSMPKSAKTQTPTRTVQSARERAERQREALKRLRPDDKTSR